MENSAKPILDTWQKEPGLGFEYFANVLGNMVVNAGAGPMTVGIFGNYGSGKTTLMHAIEKNVKNANSAKHKIIPIWFDPSRHEHEDHLILPFLSQLYRDERLVKADLNFRNRIRAGFSGFLRGLSFKANIGVASVALDANKAINAENDILSSMQKKLVLEYQDLNDSLEQLPQESETEVTILAFIDDLDRCLPVKALALLEAIKALMGISGFIFVMGLDSRAVGTYIGKKYNDLPVSADEYLEKMFQVPFHLPKPSPEEVAREIDRLLAQKIKEDSQIHDGPTGFSVWAELVSSEVKELSPYFPPNIRKAKRILNTHQIIYATICSGRENNDSKIFFRILILQTNWPDALKALIGLNSSAFKRFYNLYSGGNDASGTSEQGAEFPAALLDSKFQKYLFSEVFRYASLDQLLEYVKFIGVWS